MTAIHKNHVLIVDDDKRIRELLDKYLSEKGFFISCAGNTKEAHDVLLSQNIDVMVLDNLMPGQKGIDYLKELRTDKKNPKHRLPVLMLTALNDVQQRIHGLENGADDYLGKPFEPKELLLRLQNLLSRVIEAPLKNSALVFGSIVYDIDKSTLLKEGAPLYLTSTEHDLLRIFITNPGTVISRDTLADRIGVSLSPRTVDVQITRLRKKIEPNPKQPLYLKTVRHRGYILCPD